MEPPPIEPAPSPEPPSATADDLAEVRAALQAVAEPEIAPPEPEAPPAEHIETAASETSITAETVDIPSESVPSVGDALVLTLGAPPVTFTVAKTSATLGRGQENTIRLDDLSVSRRHARIAFRQGGYWLSDLGSMGGTWVNGTRLSAPRRLAAGEVIDIGLLRLTVGFAGKPASGATKAMAETKKSAKPRSEAAGQIRRRR